MINKKLIKITSISLGLFLILIFLTYIRVNTDISLMGDTGLHYALLQSIHDGLGPNLNIYASINDILFSKSLANRSSLDICDIASNYYSYSSKELNFFNFHTYFILYPLSLLVYLIKTPYIIQGVGIFSFISIALIAFLMCRKYTHSILISLVAAFVVTLHPAWSWSVIGQPFIDRLFLPLGILIFYYCDNKKLITSIVISLIASLINEKIGIYLALFYCSYSIIFSQKNSFKYTAYCMVTGIFFGATSYLTVNFLLNNPYYSSVILNTPTSIINYFSEPLNLNATITFIIINLSILLFSLINNKRYFLIAVIMMLPNIFSDIGGAEKINFYTHYHTLYFPFVIYSFIKSLSNINLRSITIYTILLFVILFFSILDINQSRNITYNLKLTNVYIANFYRIYLSRNNFSKITNDFKQMLPLNSKISSTESGLPYLYTFSDLNIYPLNLSNSDFLVSPYVIIDGKYFIKGYFGYLGENHNNDANTCLNTLIRNSGFNVDKPIYITPNFVVIGK